MTRSKTTKRQKRGLNTLLEKGVLTIGLGLAFLLAPLFLKSSVALNSIARALRVPGWVSLVTGVVLLTIHYVAKAKVAATEPLLKASPGEPSGKPFSKSNLRLVETPLSQVPTRRPETDTIRASAPLQGPHQTPQQWSAAVFAAIEWRRFEAVCEALFAQAGFQTRATGPRFGQ